MDVNEAAKLKHQGDFKLSQVFMRRTKFFLCCGLLRADTLKQTKGVEGCKYRRIDHGAGMGQRWGISFFIYGHFQT